MCRNKPRCTAFEWDRSGKICSRIDAEYMHGATEGGRKVFTQDDYVPGDKAMPAFFLATFLSGTTIPVQSYILSKSF